MTQTEIGCDPPRHDQDEWLSGFLTSSPTVTLSGNELTLTKDTTTIELVDREVATRTDRSSGRRGASTRSSTAMRRPRCPRTAA